MALQFEPIDLLKQAAYTRYYDQCSQKTSDYSFVNLWGWAAAYGLKWAWTDNLVWIKETIPAERYWAPVGNWKDVDWNIIFKQLFDIAGKPEFIRVPEALLLSWQKALKQALIVEETRGDWDYLYSVSELIELKGNRYHKKKNLLNQFKRRYTYRYLPFNASLVEAALGMQNDWCTWRDCESSDILSAENEAISKILKNWETLRQLMGGALFVDDRIVAYTIGEQLDPTTLVIHFEKGNPEFKGVYQAINQMFLARSADTFHIVNREQDLNQAGLRKTKESYHPVEYNKKYQVSLK